MADHLLGQVPASRPIRRGPRHHRPPPEISNYEETIIIDSVFPLEETIDFVRRGPRHHSSREITAAMSRPVRRGPRHHSPRGLGPPIPLSGYYYFTYFGHQHFMPLHQEDANYYYPAMPSTSGIYNNQRGQELSSNLQWARVEEDEETMILGGIHEDDEGVLMSGHSLSQEIITSCLKTRNSCPNDEQEDKVCAICLDDFGQESGHEMIGVLDCRHEYHVGCITKWLTNKNFCPLCKAVAL